MRHKVVIGLFGLTMFFVGLSVGTPIGAKMASTVHPDIQETWIEIQSNHPDGPFDPEELKQGAITGMVRSLRDPHSRYLAPSQAASRHETYYGDCSPPTVERTMYEAGGKNYAYIKITAFHSNTPEQFGSAAGWSIGEGAQGIILDLRGNRGGIVDAAAKVGCRWLATADMAIQVSRSGKMKAINAKCDALLADIPTVVLVDSFTASAAEMLAGALKDYRLAHLIGETTFGKGIGQNVIMYDDGAELHLTGFLWTTPLGQSIDKVGITPDHVVVSSVAGNASGDIQLELALERLASGQ